MLINILNEQNSLYSISTCPSGIILILYTASSHMRFLFVSGTIDGACMTPATNNMHFGSISKMTIK